MGMNLKEIVNELRSYKSVRRKQPIGAVAMNLLPLPSEEVLATYGEDAAVIKCGREILLMAADGGMVDRGA